MLLSKDRNAFSLIEVVVVTSILSIFFIVAISVLLVSLRNMKINEHRIYATHYARQLEDWLRVQKEINWGGTMSPACSSVDTDCGFTQVISQKSSGTKFCFNDETLNWVEPFVGADDCGYNLGGNFRRQVSFTYIASTPLSQVNATIDVSWQELGKTYSIKAKTVFSILE